jgi:hypothetical protein
MEQLCLRASQRGAWAEKMKEQGFSSLPEFSLVPCM